MNPNAISSTGSHDQKWSLPLLVIFIFSMGIDGFQGLPFLRELGGKPFYIIYLFFLLSYKNFRLLLNTKYAISLILIVLTSVVGSAFFSLEPIPLSVTGKSFPFQVFAQTAIFILTFSSIFVANKFYLTSANLSRALIISLSLHGVAIFIDFVSISLFKNLGLFSWFTHDIWRPSGFFSEPSYAGSYLSAISLAICFDKNTKLITKSTAFSFSTILCFLIGSRTSFIITAFSILTLSMRQLLAKGLSFRISAKLFSLLILSLAILAIFVLVVSSRPLDFADLSTAYRLGNSIAFFQHGLSNTLILGHGFGSADFIYTNLRFPDFMYASREFNYVISGLSESRVLVFNMFVRIFVEAGLPSLFLLSYVFLNLFSRLCMHPPLQVLLVSSVMFSMSTDSYLVPAFTLLTMLASKSPSFVRN